MKFNRIKMCIDKLGLLGILNIFLCFQQMFTNKIARRVFFNFSDPKKRNFSATESKKIFKEKQNKLHTAAARVLH